MVKTDGRAIGGEIVDVWDLIRSSGGGRLGTKLLSRTTRIRRVSRSEEECTLMMKLGAAWRGAGRERPGEVNVCM